jgi:hypothetical protein
MKVLSFQGFFQLRLAINEKIWIIKNIEIQFYQIKVMIHPSKIYLIKIVRTCPKSNSYLNLVALKNSKNTYSKPSRS